MEPGVIGEQMDGDLPGLRFEALLDLPDNGALTASPSAEQADNIDAVGIADDVRNRAGNATMRPEEIALGWMIGEEIDGWSYSCALFVANRLSPATTNLCMPPFRICS